MTDWYVRPDTSHSATRNGTSYANAWGGWSSITWGSGGVVEGDTLYVCGSHTSASVLSVGNHGADSDYVTIRGDAVEESGSIVFSGSSYLTFARSYTRLQNLAITAGTSNCIYIFGALSNLAIKECAFNGVTGNRIINISGGNGYNYTDFLIEENTFIGGSGNGGSAISWLVSAGSNISSLTRVTITKNIFNNGTADRAVIHFRMEAGAHASSTMNDIIVNDNSFSNNLATAIEIYAPDERCAGITVLRNTMQDHEPVGIIGGGIAVAGFDLSASEGFGPNLIAWNKGYRLNGPTGLVNVFYGTYRIHHNYGEDLSTPSIDANGVLPDHGCRDTVIYSNEFKRLTGKAGVFNSGCGIMILDAIRITAYGNIVDGCLTGIFIGNKVGGQSSNIYNNTFKNCEVNAINVLSTANLTDNLMRNNIFTAKNAAANSVRVGGGTFTGESRNAMSGFSLPIGHELDATDIDDDPQLDADYRPLNPAVKRTGTFLRGKDFSGKPFYDPPNLGAVDDRTTTPRYAIKKT